MFPFQDLRRWPDTQADNLFASDASDRLILAQGSPALRSADPGTVVTMGDRYGALTLAAAALGVTQIRSHQDGRVGELAMRANYDRLANSLGLPDDFEVAVSQRPLGRELLSGARVVLLQLPKSLSELGAWSRLIAHYASADVQVFAGGRVKHMTPAMNDVLRQSFGSVSASLAQQKSRVLRASAPHPSGGVDLAGLTEAFDPELRLWVCAYPGAFGGATVDHGSRFLLQFLDRADAVVSSSELRAADLGCGTGVLATALLRDRPRFTVIATDQSAAAVASTEATIARNFPDTAPSNVQVVRDNALNLQPDDSLDLILCNPPFHTGAAVDNRVAKKLFRDAARALRSGGRILTVFNSHLSHRQSLEQLIGRTTQLGKNTKFTVTESVKRHQ